MILKGSQTAGADTAIKYRFEYGVILKGSQTRLPSLMQCAPFEYGVILKGSQTCVLQGVVLS